MNYCANVVIHPTLAILNLPSRNEQGSTCMTSGRPLTLGGRKLDPIGMVVVVIADPTHLLITLHNTAEIAPTTMP